MSATHAAIILALLVGFFGGILVGMDAQEAKAAYQCAKHRKLVLKGLLWANRVEFACQYVRKEPL